LLEYHFEKIFPDCRIIDIHEYLLEKEIRLPESVQGKPYLYHDPCHSPIKTTSPMNVVKGLMGNGVLLSDRCCGESGTFAVNRPDIATQVKFRKQEEINKNLGQLENKDGVKLLTTCPACLQGLNRYRQDTGVASEFLTVETARLILGENWQTEFVEKLKNGGVEKVLL
ncbi:MAG: DUF3400 domain-containing protein, partial [Neisseriaceae bacterium]|nr:DUF3400 domain-containing protein [Neisseriaceae bacterium]